MNCGISSSVCGTRIALIAVIIQWFPYMWPPSREVTPIIRPYFPFPKGGLIRGHCLINDIEIEAHAARQSIIILVIQNMFKRARRSVHIGLCLIQPLLCI